MTSIGTALAEGVIALADAEIENPRNEARLLLAHVLELTSAQVFSRVDAVITDADIAVYYDMISQRCRGRPLAYITGHREFWSLDFQVTDATLIPRPDTETLVELARDVFEDRDAPELVIDLGTGSGCILLSIMSIFSDAHGIGIEVSESTCGIARQNVSALGFENRCKIVQASWADGLPGTYDLIVSNPPYIPSGDIERLAPSVRDFEPVGALDGGADGLDAYRAIMPCVARSLSDNGIVIVEVGIGQARDVTTIATDTGLVPGPRKRDLAGIERALSFYKKGVGIPGFTG